MRFKQLAIAKEKLTELIEASMELQESKKLLKNFTSTRRRRALERLTKAQDKWLSTKELNEVAAKTRENLLEIAMAKKELDDALKNLDALGSFDEAMGFLVESTGMKLQDLIDMANAIKSGEDIAITDLGGAGFHL